MGADKIEQKRFRFDRMAGDIEFHCLLQDFIYVARHTPISPDLIHRIVAFSNTVGNKLWRHAKVTNCSGRRPIPSRRENFV